MPRAPSRKKKAAEPASRGPTARAVAGAQEPAAVERLKEGIAEDGGTALAAYRDPVGGHWQVLAALPIDRVDPTPYQRDLSQPHVARLADAIDRLDRFLDPIVAVRTDDGCYHTPNGHQSLAALRSLGARAVVALVVPDLEVARLAQGLAELDDRPERDYAMEFEEPAFLTLGFCYQENGRFAGGSYHPVLKRVEQFSPAKLSRALETRRDRAARVLELDAAVSEAMKRLKERGFESPYLRPFVVARVNPLRFQRGAKADPDETIEKMLAAARRFDAGRIRQDQVARAGGGGGGGGAAGEE